MENQNLLVMGGCRSGKSSHALNLANGISGNRKWFIATSVPTDPEMEERVINHQKERGKDWKTAEVPVNLPDKLLKISTQADVIVVDCLTLWVSNLLFHNYTQPEIFAITEKMKKTLKQACCPVFLVSNEVGCGIVPENRLARQFRDMAGFVNQKIAASVHGVVWMVAGIPVTIKPGHN